MKRLIKFIVFVGLIITAYIYRDNISHYILENFVINKEVIVSEANIYYKKADYSYVQLTDNFKPESRQDLLNIFYTMLNSGWESFYFYCENSYESCYDDINSIAKETNDLSIINNMVNPYNSYKYLSFEMSSLGKITINIDKLYNESEINYVNEQIDLIMKEIIKENMTTKEKIRAFHDYVINNTNYDESNTIAENMSNKAYGALLNKKAVCSGYSDLMGIFLDKINVRNYKISNDEHVWNLVNLDGTWYHIDLTWDDPTTSNGKPVLLHDFFLIKTNELEKIGEKLKNNQHNFDKTIYIEAT